MTLAELFSKLSNQGDASVQPNVGSAQPLAGQGLLGQTLQRRKAMLDDPTAPQGPATPGHPDEQPSAGTTIASRPAMQDPNSPEAVAAWVQANGIKRRTFGDDIGSALAQLRAVLGR